MSFAELLSAFRKVRALVVGDIMLDEYVFGRATRISPEAPVMVVRQNATRAVPGGAANVANNMSAMGATVQIIGVLGCDSAGDTLAAELLRQGGAEQNFIRDPGRPTTRKTRIVANHSQQVLRIDHEDETPVSGAVESSLLDRVLTLLPSVNIVLVSDYLKGAITPRLVETLVSEGAKASVPVVANAKPKSLPYYRGAALVSLNQFEAGDALGLRHGVPHADAAAAADELRRRLGVDRVLITLGAGGIAAAGERAFAVPAVDVVLYDEAGAGDTVIATMALGIGAGAFSHELLSLAAHTAASVVQKVGVSTPSAEDLAHIATL